jgi:transposase
LNERIGVSNEEWLVIGPLLPPERGRWSRPAQDNRCYFEGMLWVARTGSQWRYLPDHYGKWNSVFRRYRRWIKSSIFDAMLDTLAELAGQDRQAHMVDSTVIRAHHCAVGIKRDSRSRGARPLARRLLDQDPRPMRWQRTPGRLHPDARTNARQPRLSAAFADDRRAHPGDDRR